MYHCVVSCILGSETRPDHLGPSFEFRPIVRLRRNVWRPSGTPPPPHNLGCAYTRTAPPTQGPWWSETRSKLLEHTAYLRWVTLSDPIPLALWYKSHNGCSNCPPNSAVLGKTLEQAGGGMGGTPRGTSSTCGKRDNCPTLIVYC